MIDSSSIFDDSQPANTKFDVFYFLFVVYVIEYFVSKRREGGNRAISMLLEKYCRMPLSFDVDAF